MASDRLFVGVFSTGISYADRQNQSRGDYARLGFLHFDTLELSIEKSCPADLRMRIETDAAAFRDRRGELFSVSTCGQTVRLGGQACQQIH